MVLLYMVIFTINIPQMLAYIYIPYMDPMGISLSQQKWLFSEVNEFLVASSLTVHRLFSSLSMAGSGSSSRARSKSSFAWQPGLKVR